MRLAIKVHKKKKLEEMNSVDAAAGKSISIVVESKFMLCHSAYYIESDM